MRACLDAPSGGVCAGVLVNREDRRLRRRSPGGRRSGRGHAARARAWRVDRPFDLGCGDVGALAAPPGDSLRSSRLRRQRSSRRLSGGSRCRPARLASHARSAGAHSVGQLDWAAIAIGAALVAGDRVRLVMAHEPPFLCLLDGDTRQAELVRRRRAGVARALDAIRARRLLRRCADLRRERDLGAGCLAGNCLNPSARNSFATPPPSWPRAKPWMASCPTSSRSPDWATGWSSPGESAAAHTFGPSPRPAARLAPGSGCVFPGAGHVPQQSHPDDFVRTTLALIQGRC